jgi:hypothetical protein
MPNFKKKANIGLNELPSLAITFVIAALFLGIGATILTNTQQNGCSGREAGLYFQYINGTCMRSSDLGNWSTIGNTAWNSSGNGLTSVSTLSQWLPTIAIVIAAAIILGVVGILYINRRSG